MKGFHSHYLIYSPLHVCVVAVEMVQNCGKFLSCDVRESWVQILTLPLICFFKKLRYS